MMPLPAFDLQQADLITIVDLDGAAEDDGGVLGLLSDPENP
jgi:hypothetical protein